MVYILLIDAWPSNKSTIPSSSVPAVPAASILSYYKTIHELAHLENYGLDLEWK